jgi:ribosomal RNA-processing protein 17
LKQAAQAGYIESEEEEDGASDDDGDTAEEWGGFQDNNPVVQQQGDLVDHEEEYIDEDRFTTVTVESVNISKDGLTSSRPDEDGESEGEDEGREVVEENNSDQKIQPEQKKRRSDKDGHGTPMKKKKQKFRYETKLERQITTIKQKAKNKRRRGN